MHGRELFSRWAFATFSPGTIPRNKYNAFREIHAATLECLRALAELEELENFEEYPDWREVVTRTVALTEMVGTVVNQLQIMDPVRFMDLHDRLSKIAFYARFAVSPTSLPASPPYLTFFLGREVVERFPVFSCVAERNMETILCLETAFFQYVLEAADLRPELDAQLVAPLTEHDADNLLAELVCSVAVPDGLRREVEIATIDIARQAGSFDLFVLLGTEDCWSFATVVSGCAAGDIMAVWRKMVTQKYTVENRRQRRKKGLADEEDGLVMLIVPAGLLEHVEQEANFERQEKFSGRLRQVLHQVTRLTLFEREGEALITAACRSLHDLVALCREQGLEQIFAFAGTPGLGLGALKQLRLEIPLQIQLFNIAEGLFPSAAEKASITPEDLRSVPAWSLFLGMACPTAWAELHITPVTRNYVVLSQSYLYASFRFAENICTIECDCQDECPGFVRFRFKGSGTFEPERLAGRRDVLERILKEDGFHLDCVGDFVDAYREDSQHVVLQRSLVRLGVLIAWVQTYPAEDWAGVEPSTLCTHFQMVLEQARNAPQIVS